MSGFDGGAIQNEQDQQDAERTEKSAVLVVGC